MVKVSWRSTRIRSLSRWLKNIATVPEKLYRNTLEWKQLYQSRALIENWLTCNQRQRYLLFRDTFWTTVDWTRIFVQMVILTPVRTNKIWIALILICKVTLPSRVYHWCGGLTAINISVNSKGWLFSFWFILLGIINKYWMRFLWYLE